MGLRASGSGRGGEVRPSGVRVWKGRGGEAVARPGPEGEGGEDLGRGPIIAVNIRDFLVMSFFDRPSAPPISEGRGASRGFP
jgi:hypothetical protein